MSDEQERRDDGKPMENPPEIQPDVPPAAPRPSAPPPPSAPHPPVRRKSARRKFIRSAVLGVGIIGIALLGGFIPLKVRASSRLRPPGALEEHDFLASCIKCGQCVQVCPVLAIELEDADSGFGLGTPYIDARKQACDFSCDAGQCILACPTGALTYDKPGFLDHRKGMELAKKPTLKAKEHDPEPTLNLRERMGVAILARPESCLAVQGKGFKGQARGPDFKGKMRYTEVDRWKPIRIREHPYERDLCDLCVTECPIKDAIRMDGTTGADGREHHVPVVLEQCIGCGVCEMICPVEPAAIVVDARREWS